MVRIIVMSLMIVGCASSSKEDLRDIFASVKDKQFDQAERKFQSKSYSTYLGVTIPAVNSPNHDDVDSLISGAKTHMELCEKLNAEISKLTLETDDFETDFTRVQEDFATHCVGFASQDWSQVSKIKRFSTVDLMPVIQAYETDFKKEVDRIHLAQENKKAEEEKARSLAEEEQKTYEGTADYLSKKLCEMQSVIDAATSIVSKEKEAAQISGFVDKEKMYQSGRAVTINRDRIQHFSSYYKTKFGKEWSSSDCKGGSVGSL